jgi:hypothetical protein
MFKDLFITIAAGVIGVLPVQPPPAVIITAQEIEASVVQTIEVQEKRDVTTDCKFEFQELSVKENEPQSFSCLTIDKEDKQEFQTKVSVYAFDNKVTISAIIASADEDANKKDSPVATPKKVPAVKATKEK